MHQAVDLANRHDAQLALLGFVEPLRPWQREINVAGTIVDVERLLTESHTKVLSSMAKRAGGADVAVEVKTGKPFQEVSRFVMAKDIDLVIVGEPAPEQGRDQGLSPGVMQLLRTCPAPVWVMRPSRARKLRVLALVDPDPTDRTRDELNQKILELAMSLAARHGVAAAGGRTHMVHGDPSKALPALCELTRCNLVVLGTVARTGLFGLIMGNTAETILRSVSCSVLALKPDGFETPVRLPDGRFRSRP